MKNFVLILLLCISLNAFSSNYEPTNFTGDKQELRDFFDSLWDKFKNYDNYHCYRRAHILSYQMKQEDVNSMKVFFFKGSKLEMPMNWYYHVAPMVYYKNEPVVMDKGLFEGATFLRDWLFSFGEGHACKQISSMQEYRDSKKNEVCMYMITPMYYYSPKDLESFYLDDFVTSDLSDMLFSLTKRERTRYTRQYPLP